MYNNIIYILLYHYRAWQLLSPTLACAVYNAHTYSHVGTA